MSVVIKNSAKATVTIRYKLMNTIKSILIQPGRNILTDSDYKDIKDHTGFKAYVNKDVFTINTEGATAKAPAKEPDFDYVESLIGREDGKDIIKEYALGWSIILNKKNTVENMVADFIAQYKEK